MINYFHCLYLYAVLFIKLYFNSFITKPLKSSLRRFLYHPASLLTKEDPPIIARFISILQGMRPFQIKSYILNLNFYKHAMESSSYPISPFHS